MAFGDIKHTGMHNRFGGYENDCSVARLSENRFMLMSPSIQQMKSYAWMRHHLPSDGSVYLGTIHILRNQNFVQFLHISSNINFLVPTKGGLI